MTGKGDVEGFASFEPQIHISSYSFATEDNHNWGGQWPRLDTEKKQKNYREDGIRIM